MSSEYDVSIIIINFNGKRFIDALFRSLQEMRTEGIRHEIIVVNNGNDDHSIEYLRENYGQMEQLKIVDAGGNLGYAGGNNAGVRQAQGEYVVFLNNDTAVDKNWLVSLHSFIRKNPSCGMANSKLLFFYDFVTLRFHTTDKIVLSKSVKMNGTEYTVENRFCKNLLYETDRLVCFGHTEISLPLFFGCCDMGIECFCMESSGPQDTLLCCGREVPAESSRTISVRLEGSDIRQNRYSLVQNAGNAINENYDGYDIGFGERDSDTYSRPYELAGGCGASIIMPRKDFEACGGFDERFFMYYEDMDLSFRLRKLGKTILFCPESVVRHIHTGSSGEGSPFFCYQVSRNKLLFLLKHVSGAKFAYYLIRQLLAAIKSRNRYQLQGCVDAFQTGILKRNVQFADRYGNGNKK